jgi:hypothetical protein
MAILKGKIAQAAQGELLLFVTSLMKKITQLLNMLAVVIVVGLPIDCEIEIAY